ncbi:iron chelate uptake ABC transporter family permease subunit, partial [Lactobacillus mulieris]
VAVAVVAAAAVWRGAAAETMILLGIALSFFFQALLSLMQYGATLEALQQIVFWTLGSMQRATWLADGIIGALLAAAVPFVVFNAWRLTALRLG